MNRFLVACASGTRPPLPDGASGCGWIVVDPTGAPYAWYGSALACDAAAVWAVFEPDPDARAALVDAGWSVRDGSGVELISGTATARVSA